MKAIESELHRDAAELHRVAWIRWESAEKKADSADDSSESWERYEDAIQAALDASERAIEATRHIPNVSKAILRKVERLEDYGLGHGAEIEHRILTAMHGNAAKK